MGTIVTNNSLDSIFEILQRDPQKYTPNVPKRDTKDNNLLDVLCTVINKLITSGDKLKNDRREFYPPNRKPPTIGIDAYLARLLKYSPCSKECFVMCLVYIDRFLRNCDLIVNSMNIHRIVITSLLISTKYLDDIFYNNEFYSQVGGISLREMNGLEVCFLSMMDYTVNCSLDEFEKYSREVDKVKKKFEELNNLSALSQHQQQQIPQPIVSNSYVQQHPCVSTNKNNQSPVAVVPNIQNNTSSNNNVINNTSLPTHHYHHQQQQQHYHHHQQQHNHQQQTVPQSSSNPSNGNVNLNNNYHYSNQSSQPTYDSHCMAYVNNNTQYQQPSQQQTNNCNTPTKSSVTSTIPISTRRRGSCDHSASIQNTKDKSYTGWVA